MRRARQKLGFQIDEDSLHHLFPQREDATLKLTFNDMVVVLAIITVHIVIAPSPLPLCRFDVTFVGIRSPIEATYKKAVYPLTQGFIAMANRFWLDSLVIAYCKHIISRQGMFGMTCN